MSGPGWEYAGRWALVTGASAGLGRVFCQKLAERGMNLVLSARRLERLEEVAASIRSAHDVETLVVVADLLEPTGPARLWTEATNGRVIDLLVNNAGFGAQGDFTDVPLDRHLDLVRLNCAAVLELAHRALTDMRPRGRGGIVNVSSVAAFQPVPRLGSYAASKAFVLSLSESLWAENGTSGVRVLALCPGRTATEFQAIAGTGSAEGAFGYRTPEQVVESGLRALERGKAVEVPGFENLVATWAVRAMPRSLLVRAMTRVVRRFWRA